MGYKIHCVKTVIQFGDTAVCGITKSQKHMHIYVKLAAFVVHRIQLLYCMRITKRCIKV